MSILKRLQEIKQLPTLPEVILNVQALINSDDTDASVLAHFIGQDIALSSTILKTANSVYYNSNNRRISSIQEAIARVGFKEVLRITMAMSLIKIFHNTKSIIGYKTFWTHSLSAAGLTAAIAEHITVAEDSVQRQEMFTAGLLHDIGILIYDQFFHDEFTAIIEFALHQGKRYLEAESELFPRESHWFVGGALLELWRLAPAVINAVRFHHTPDKAPEKDRISVAVVALAEYILCNQNIRSFEGKIVALDPIIQSTLKLDEKIVSSLFTTAELEAEKADILLSIGTDAQDISSLGDQKHETDDFQLRYI